MMARVAGLVAAGRQLGWADCREWERECVAGELGRERESASEEESKARLENREAEIRENKWAKP